MTDDKTPTLAELKANVKTTYDAWCAAVDTGPVGTISGAYQAYDDAAAALNARRVERDADKRRKKR